MLPQPSLLDSRHASKKYTAAELKAVGERCSPDLPPATIMQQMFMYENKRQAENEKLFHHHMLRLARLEDDSTSNKSTLDKQETAIKSLQQNVAKLAPTHKDHNVNTKLDNVRDRVAGLEHKSLATDDAVTRFQRCIDQVASLLTSLNTSTATTSAPTASRNIDAPPDADLTLSAPQDIARDERVARCEERLDKLQDLVRCLTQQQAVNDNRPSPLSARLPVITSGEPLDLLVPQGSPLVHHKENRSTTKPADSKMDLLDWPGTDGAEPKPRKKEPKW